jgi:hypothetical protein
MCQAVAVKATRENRYSRKAMKGNGLKKNGDCRFPVVWSAASDGVRKSRAAMDAQVGNVEAMDLAG